MKGILKLVESYIVHTAPIRVGLVLNVTDSRSASGLEDAGVAMQCAMNYIIQLKDAPTALNFLRSVMTRAKDKVTVEDVKEELSKQFNDDPMDILGNLSNNNQ